MQIGIFIQLFNMLFFHPVHVSVCNIEYNSQNKKAEVTIKLYKDDFATLLNAKYNLSINKDSSDDFKKNQNCITNYILENFQLYTDKKQIKRVIFKDLETDKESIWIYFSIKKIKPFSNLSINNTLLLDLYNDQTNLVITKIDSFQKGYTLDIEKNYVNISIQ